MERRKFFSADASAVVKFIGHGKYGEAAMDRSQRLATAGFSPATLGRSNGFTRTEWVAGTPLRDEELNEAIVERIAQYCVFRAAEFSAAPDSRDVVDLAAMTRVNLKEEFGVDAVPVDLTLLKSQNKIITDSRMMPQAWIGSVDGKILKTNASLHGDDHFFPGPCDIAWDLAGAIVEWQMGECVANQFLARFAHLSGDDASPRIAAFITAYAAFRMGYCKMAADAMQGTDEESRLRRDYLRYCGVLTRKAITPELARAA
jgi:hypothetical protein